MPTSIIVADDFLADPMALREAALKLDYPEDSGSAYPGRNSSQRIEVPGLTAEVSRMVYPDVTWWNGEVQVVFQTIANLHASIAGPCGDWYFTGDYPTPGGTSVANAAFVAYYEKLSGRTYDLVF